MKMKKIIQVRESRKGKVKPQYPGACTCPCHTKPIRIVHPVPCCEPCPYCKKRIARGLLYKHEPYCEKKPSKAELSNGKQREAVEK